MKTAPVVERSAPIDIPKRSAPRACLPEHVSASAACYGTALDPTLDALRLERQVRFAQHVEVRIIPAREPTPPPAPPVAEPQVAEIFEIESSCTQRLANAGAAVCILGVIGSVPAAIILGPIWAAMPCGFAVGLVACQLVSSRPIFEGAGEQDYIGP